MSCLKSFTLSSNQALLISGVVFTQNGNNYFNFQQNLNSKFNIQGFKNVNIHGVDVIGEVRGAASTTNTCIIQDWSTTIILDGGTIPQISGNIEVFPNDWNLDNSSILARRFTIGKYINKINFASPFESVKSIDFVFLNASGISSAVTIGLNYDIQWIFYYTYEGEQF